MSDWRSPQKSALIELFTWHRARTSAGAVQSAGSRRVLSWFWLGRRL